MKHMYYGHIFGHSIFGDSIYDTDYRYRAFRTRT